MPIFASVPVISASRPTSSATRSRAVSHEMSGTPRPSRESTRRWSSGPAEPQADSVPTAPASWPTSSRGRADSMRARWRRISAIHTDALKPNVIGSPGWPCVRPSMTASRWRTASSTSDVSTAARSREAIASIRCATRPVQVSATSCTVAPNDTHWRALSSRSRCSTRISPSVECPLRRVSSPTASRSTARSARSAIAAAAPAGMRPSSPCSAATAPSTASQIRVRPSSPNSSSVSGVDQRCPKTVTRTSSRNASRTSSSAAPHGTTRPLALAPHAALEQAALHQRRPVRRAHHARAEVDPGGRLGPVQRDVDLARALAAHQRPVAHLLRAGVEEVALEAGAAARVHRATRRRQPAQVDRLEPQIDRRQVLVVVDDRARHLQQLRRLGRDDLEHAHPHRRGLDDEVHVLEATLHDGHARPRDAGHLRRVARVDGRVVDERDLVRARQHAQVRRPSRGRPRPPGARPARPRAPRRAWRPRTPCAGTRAGRSATPAASPRRARERPAPTRPGTAAR